MVTAAQLDLIIRAQDQASRVIRGIDKELGGLNTTLGKFGLGGALSVAAVGGALSAFAAGGLQEFAEADAVMRQTTAALESTGSVAGVTAEHVEDLAGKMMRLSAVDDEVIQRSENVLLTFTNIRNIGIDKTFDRATEAALNLSARMGGDLQGATLLVGKALNDPIKGMTALSRAGVQLSDAQKDLIRQFVATGDVASAQKVILKELETQFGGSAKAAGEGFAGQLKILQLRFENFQGQVMGETVPAILALTGFIDDTTVAIGKLADASEAVTGPIGDAFGFFGDVLDKVPDELKAVAVGAAMLSNPITAAAGGLEGLRRLIDANSDSTDDAVASTHEFATALENAQGRAMMASQAIAGVRAAADGPMGAIGIRNGLQAVTDDAFAAKDAADKAKRAFFDLLNQPSVERQQRELLLSQAEFNVSRLEQQGAKEGMLSPDRQAWYQWLVDTFIPAQEQWLDIDSQRVDRDEKAATLADRLTGSYQNMDQAIRGNLTPGLDQYTSGLYDADAAMQGLKLTSPAALKVTLNETPSVATKAEKIRRDFRGETPGSFGVGIADPKPTVPTVAARLRSGFRGETPAIFGVGLTDPTPKVPTMAARLRSGFRGETPATFGVGLTDPTPQVPTMAARLRSGFRGETPATFGVGLTDPTPQVPTTAERVRSGFRGETPATMGVGVYGPTDATVSATVGAIKSKILYYWSLLWGGGAGVTFRPSELQTAQVIAAAGFPGFRPHNEQGATAGSMGGTTVIFSAGSIQVNGVVGTRRQADEVVEWIFSSLKERLRNT